MSTTSIYLHSVLQRKASGAVAGADAFTGQSQLPANMSASGDEPRPRHGTKLKPNCIDTLTFFRVVPENVLTGLGVDRCRSRRRAVRSAPQHRTCPVRSSLLLSCVRPLVSADAAFEAARIFKL
ncbi:hypothetical protein F2P81_018858 [Scophthalmus maximus]|uniref:Uncharacterized protein n=1 Tax=Scophthalmus maximus TaxID=52904 RepID=A0A6A4S5T2_SCOMX|nr:hypothetical protein F2P81_018858 [Scophthalmus maximus]